jgi:hypothetical protein
MRSEIRELSFNELDIVSGGNPILVGIAIGVASNVVYDFMKSHQGIQDAIDYLKNHPK